MAISIVIAILTIAASGVVATIVAYRLNATKEHVYFMRQKSEALYLAHERYDRMLGSDFVTYYSVIKNEISYDDLLDIKIKNHQAADSESASAFDVLTMLTNVYFPGLRSQLERYTAARDGVREILADHKRAYKKGDTDGRRWLNPFHEAMLELSSVAAAFKQAIITEARNLAPAERLWPRSLTLPQMRTRIADLFRSKAPAG